AEDAFQATFLVLVRKAGSIARPEALPGWLHTIAVRTATRARATARRARPVPPPEDVPAPDVPDPGSGDLRAVLDEELARLPEKYRLPVILCHLEGQTARQAARRLGCPRGTVLSHLKRGRDRLRIRLLRRGLAPPAVALGAELTRPTALPAALVERVLSGAASAEVAALTQGVLTAMFLTKLKMSALLVVLAVAGTGTTVATYQAAAGGQPGGRPAASSRAPDAPPRKQPPVPAAKVELSEPAGSARFSPDGRRVATYSRRVEQADGKPTLFCTFRIWDATTGELLLSLGEIENPGVNTFGFSPDGKLLAISHRRSIEGGDKVELWDVQKGELKTAIEADYGRSRLWFAFSPDGKLLAVPYGGPSNKLAGGARVFDTGTGELMQTVLGHEHTADTVAFSPDGKALATGGYKGKVMLWDLETGKATRTLDVAAGPVAALAFSPDGKTLATGGSFGLRLWDTRTGEARSLSGAAGNWQSLRFSPDSRLLLAGGSDPGADEGKQEQARLWDVRSGKLLSTWEGVNRSSVGFTADGEAVLLLRGEKTVERWEVK
ncbi:MAG TPA: sigma-70 family RNA polymerase sigma factor, partial [Gemmataceae bacterium]